MLQVQETEFDVEDIYLAYTGESIKKNKSFLELLEWHNNKTEKLVVLNMLQDTTKSVKECTC